MFIKLWALDRCQYAMCQEKQAIIFVRGLAPKLTLNFRQNLEHIKENCYILYYNYVLHIIYLWRKKFQFISKLRFRN